MTPGTPDHLSHGGRIHDDPDPASVLDFSSNVNPYGPPRRALAAARKALKQVGLYPDPEVRGLREAIGRRLGRPAEDIVCGNGASELIRAALELPGTARLVQPVPTFSEYASAARREGIPVRGLPSEGGDPPERGFRFPLERLREELREGDLLVLCRPNNPTGEAVEGKVLAEILRTIRERGARLLADECFLELADPPLRPLPADPMPEGTVVLRAFTKDFSAPGLRLGYAVSDAGTAAALRERLQPWPVSCVAEAFGRACMEEPEPFLSRSRRRLARAREMLAGELTKRGFRVCPSRANFILVRSPLPGALLAPRLEARRARIRRCDNFEGLDDGWIRFAVKDRESIRRLLPLLDEAMEPDRGSARGGAAPGRPPCRGGSRGAERAAEPLASPCVESSGTRDT